MRFAPSACVFFRQFFEPRLAQFSYLIGCVATGEAIVVDPNRRIEQYLAAAHNETLQITAVTETHIHADFASGALALAKKSGATLYVSGEGAPAWAYAFAGDRLARTLRHGDRFRTGRIRFDAVHTPGHTPEHLAYMVTDEAASTEAWGLLTGDFLFAGDVGRPDLLEKAAGFAGTADASARRLYGSLRALADFPDRLLIWPGHGAGSACGKKLGGVPVTSLGYERLTNWALQPQHEDEFVRAVLVDQPDPPRYFAEMKRVNRHGAPTRRRAELIEMGTADIEPLVGVHRTFIDLRPAATANGVLPGSIALPLSRHFLTWAGSVLRYGVPIYIVAASRGEAQEAIDALALIGIDDVRGWLPSSVLDAYRRGGGLVERLVDLEPGTALQRQKQGHVLLDVRTTAEWSRGQLRGALHAPLAQLVERVSRLDRDTPLVVYCEAGTRSRIAATALRRIGFTHVANLSGGYVACRKERPESLSVSV